MAAITISCTKQQYEVRDMSQLKMLAFQVLKEKMDSSNFSTLDWNSVQEKSLNNVPYFLKIKSITKPNQYLLFSKIGDKIIYNYVESYFQENVSNIDSNILIIKDVDNEILNRFAIVKNITRSNSLSIKTQSLEATKLFNKTSFSSELPEVVVTAYINNQRTTWWSLYWLFNGNNAFNNQYTQIDFIQSDCSNCISANYDITLIENLFPETSEILIFESDYRARMSPEELEIFDDMSRGDQLRYLWNAKTSIELAEDLFPSSILNGKGDAFRHANFNALNAKYLGIDLAKRLADAHELKLDQQELARIMDLRNNQIGRELYLRLVQIANNNLDYSIGVSLKLIQMIYAGELWHLKPLDSWGNVIPGVTQLVKTNE